MKILYADIETVRRVSQVLRTERLHGPFANALRRLRRWPGEVMLRLEHDNEFVVVWMKNGVRNHRGSLEVWQGEWTVKEF